MTTKDAKNPDELTEKGARSRSRIISAGMAVIRKKGYKDTNMQDICNAAGIGIGTYYHYFQTKQELLMAFVEEESQSLRDFYENLDKSSCKKAIKETIFFYLQMFRFKGPEVVSVIYSSFIRGEMKFFNARERAFLEVLIEAYRVGQQQCEFSKLISPECFGDIASGLIFYITSVWCNSPDLVNLDELLNQRFDELLDLVAVKA